MDASYGPKLVCAATRAGAKASPQKLEQPFRRWRDELRWYPQAAPKAPPLPRTPEKREAPPASTGPPIPRAVHSRTVTIASRNVSNTASPQ